MRRHSATDNGGAAKATEKSERREESPKVSGLPAAEQIEEQLLSGIRAVMDCMSSRRYGHALKDTLLATNSFISSSVYSNPAGNW
jgi:hypothetical protein